MKQYDQVFIMQSSTNIDRLVSFIKAGLLTNHKVVLDLFSRYVAQTANIPTVVDNKIYLLGYQININISQIGLKKNIWI